MINKPNKSKRSGSDEDKKQFKEELIDLARVTRVVKWWRRMRFRATVAVWDDKWSVWLGIWKANEVTVAIQKATKSAKKCMILLPIVDWTIAHDIKIRFKWANILLMPACDWTWIIAWWSIRKIAEVSWIRNILAKRFWSNNKVVNAQAMMKAIKLLSTSNSVEDIRVKKEKEKALKEQLKSNDGNDQVWKKTWWNKAKKDLEITKS